MFYRRFTRYPRRRHGAKLWHRSRSHLPRLENRQRDSGRRAEVSESRRLQRRLRGTRFSVYLQPWDYIRGRRQRRGRRNPIRVVSSAIPQHQHTNTLSVILLSCVYLCRRIIGGC